MVFPVYFWVLFAAAMLISAIGFKKYVWFISLGYGFSIAVPGLSKTMIAAINGHDNWLTMGIVIFYVFIGLFMAILADLSYGVVDPRIRMGGKKDE